MLYYNWTVGGKDYKCRLTARACVDLEKKLGENPLNVFIKIANANGALPSVGDMVTILHASLQSMEHGISLDRAYELYDQYVDEGHTLVEFIPVILEIFKVSGFFNVETEGKNAQQEVVVQ